MDLLSKFSIKILISVLAVFAPVKSVVLTVICLIVVDLITGIWASHKQKVDITSAALGRTIVKAFVYLSAVLLSFLVQQYLTTDAIPCVHIVSSFIGITELLSCMENINIIGGGDLLKKIIDSLSSRNKEL